MIDILRQRSQLARGLLVERSPLSVPIQRLPPEILGYILAIVINSFPCVPAIVRCGSIRQLSLVCATWRRVVIGAWSHLDLDLNCLTPDSLLARTQNWFSLYDSRLVDLHLSCKESTPELPPYSQSSVLQLQQLVMISRSITVEDNTSHRQIKALLDAMEYCNSLDLLRSLTISQPIRTVGSELDISWPATWLPTLSQLNLCNLPASICPNSVELETILLSSPSLRILRLIRLNIFRVPPRSSPPDLNLPHLHTLQLTHLSGSGLPEILSSLSPSSANLDLRLDINVDDDVPPFDLLLPRLNVVSMSIGIIGTGDRWQRLQHYLSLTPSLQILQLNYQDPNINWFTNLNELVDISPFVQLPQLHSLCLVKGYVSPGVLRQVDQIITTFKLRTVAFYGCGFPPTFVRPRQDSNVHWLTAYKGYPKMPRKMGSWLSARVRNVIVHEDAPDLTLHLPPPIEIDQHGCS